MTLIEAYRRERAPFPTPFGVRQEGAARALYTARTKVAWDAACGYVCDESDAPASGPSAYRPGRVRLMLRPDQDGAADDFDGSEGDLQEARDRASQDGMWGVEAQFWDGAEWQNVDAVWGFIGDDWSGSGYDSDLMRAALDALAEHDAEAARAWEGERPDLYGATRH